MANSERILITVRTYPTPSASYRETVCTGGINAAGEWRRLYPVALRYLRPEQQFKTWDVIEVDVRADPRDHRPESRRPHQPTLRKVDQIDTWLAKWEWVQPTVRPSLRAIVEAARSLGPVAVKDVMDFTATKGDAAWDPVRKAKLEAMSLFDRPLPLERIPYQFHAVWRDQDGEEHKSSIISWELAQTWRTYRRRYSDPLAKMKEKLLGDYFAPSRQVSFFMGNHSRFRQTFMVCGWFIPPRGEVANVLPWGESG